MSNSQSQGLDNEGAINEVTENSPASSALSSHSEVILPEQVGESVRNLFGLSFGSLEIFADLLFEEGELRGLIGPRERSRLWSRHIVNSAALLDFLPSHGSVIDIGSGAGFPGIIIAACRPDLEIHLVDPMSRRCEWLSLVVDEMDLDNVFIHEGRAEDLKGKMKGQAVTSRAVASMVKLVPMCSKLIAPGGRLLALKGRRAHDEVSDAATILKRHHLTAKIHEIPSILEDESTYVVECRRN